MHFVMQPGMVYQYPLWGVGLLLAGVAAGAGGAISAGAGADTGAAALGGAAAGGLSCAAFSA